MKIRRRIGRARDQFRRGPVMRTYVRLFGCLVCYGTGVVMVPECTCGGNEYYGHEQYCATFPCPRDCEIARTADDALRMWAPILRQQEARSR